MAVTTFIPEVWAASLMRALQKDLVYGQRGIVNRDYEGQIRQAGDTVHIGTIGAVTVKDYTRNSTIDAPETLATTDQSLLIDQQKYFNFEVDDVDAAQAAGDLIGPAKEEASYALADTADQFIAALFDAGVAAGNRIGTDVSPLVVDTATEAYDYLVDISVALDDAHVPKQGRWCIIPSWWDGLLAKEDRVLRAQPQVIPNGFAGRVRGMTILTASNVPNTGGALYKIIAGYPGALTFAEQIVKVEAFRPQDTFSDAVKGLHVYGGKLVRSTGIVVATASKTAGS